VCPTQLWAHTYHQNFHANVYTDNLAEAFNHTLRSRYLHLRQDSTVADFVDLLLKIVFPEQEHEYAIAVTQQTEAYRKPRYDMPDYLRNRPHTVQAQCLANMASAKQFNFCDVTTDKEGIFTVKSSDKSIQ